MHERPERRFSGGDLPGVFSSRASLCGVGIVINEEDSPHLLAERIKGELYFGFSEVDDLVPEIVIPALEAALKNNGIRYECKPIPGTRDGFSFEERSVYNREAAKDIWENAFALFDCRLG